MKIIEAATCDRPRCIPQGRPRGIKAKGLQYEKALEVALGKPIVRGQWWQYRIEGEWKDRWCQTDLLLVGPRIALVVECKLSWVPEGQRSLEEMYLPVVAVALGRPARGIVACRYLRGAIGVPVVGSFDEAMAAALEGPVVLHWMPGTPARRQERKVA